MQFVVAIPLNAYFNLWFALGMLGFVLMAFAFVGEVIGVCLWTVCLLAGIPHIRAAWLAEDWQAADLRKKYPWLTAIANFWERRAVRKAQRARIARAFGRSF